MTSHIARFCFAVLGVGTLFFTSVVASAQGQGTAPGSASPNVHPSSDASAAKQQQMMDEKGSHHGRYCWRGMSGHMHCRAHY
jgi:hypothetical protein